MTTSEAVALSQYFKSAAIALRPNATKDDYQIGTEKLIHWLTEFDHWFKQSSGIYDGQRPYAAYNRQLSLYGDEMLSLPDKLSQLAAESINKGIAVSITADLVDLYNHFDFIQSLCEQSLLSSIGVVTDSIDYIAEHLSIESFFEQLVELKRPLGLIGSIAKLHGHGVFRYAALNKTDLTIYPAEAEFHTGQAPIHPVKPCVNRFILYIDDDGFIYPCLGLLGLTDYALGHIDDEISATALAGRDYKLDLLHLLQYGPELPDQGSHTRQQRQTNLPWACEQHRSALLAEQ